MPKGAQDSSTSISPTVMSQTPLSEYSPSQSQVHVFGSHCAIDPATGLFSLSSTLSSFPLPLVLSPLPPCRWCASLHYLSLSHCSHFTSKGLHPIMGGKGCRRLVYLDLSGCTQLTPEGMQFLGRGCPILNTLLLNDLPDISDSMILVGDTTYLLCNTSVTSHTQYTPPETHADTI